MSDKIYSPGTSPGLCFLSDLNPLGHNSLFPVAFSHFFIFIINDVFVILH